MGIGSGLGGQIGVAKETTYGTYVAPTKFYEVTSAKLKLDRTMVDGGGIAAGRFARLQSQSVTANRSGSGSAEMSVPIVGFGRVLEQLFGGTITPVQQGGTPAYLQTIPLVDTAGNFLTVQLGLPSTNGTVNPYSFLGGKITKADFKCAKDGFLSSTLDFDFRDVSEAQSLATATYPTSAAPFNFTQMTVKVGTTVAGAAAVQGIDGFSLSVERKQKTDRYYANAAGLKAEPITNDFVVATGTIDADFVTKADFADRWASDTGFALVWEFVGAVISGANNYKLTFEIPAVKLTGDSTPSLDGTDVLHNSFPFAVYSDGTNPIITCKYQTTDVTL